MQGWVSPRLKIRFELDQGELRLFGPDNHPFLTYLELVAQRDQAERERNDALKKFGQQAETLEKVRLSSRLWGSIQKVKS